MSSNNRPFLSIIAPCYNEEAILQHNMQKIVDTLESFKEKYRWEVVIVDDGSKDATGQIADELAKTCSNIRVIHHPVNLNLGRALQTGFRHSNGDIIIVLDIDLSYSVEYVEKMADKLLETYSDIVIASPYMKGGKVIAVPFLRKMMSLLVNKF